VFVVLLLAAGGGGYVMWKQRQESQPKRPDPFVARTEPTDGNAGPDTPTEPSLPVDPAGTSPTNTSRPSTTKEKDDKELQLFEANARVALLELLGKNMSPTDAARRAAFAGRAVSGHDRRDRSRREG
jgi:hypothetical protein